MRNVKEAFALRTPDTLLKLKEIADLERQELTNALIVPGGIMTSVISALATLATGSGVTAMGTGVAFGVTIVALFRGKDLEIREEELENQLHRLGG